MGPDLSDILDEWPIEPGTFNVRMIQGRDGRPKIQVRLDLGLLQMNAEGRPDGTRPMGFDSLLEYFEAQADLEGRVAPEDEDETPTEPKGSEFKLTREDCQSLRHEATQYYQRYTALMILEDYEGVVRDTTRNLRMLDFVAEHASDDDDKSELESSRPYIMMIRARALASQAIEDEEPKVALIAIDEGLEALRKYFAERGDGQGFEESSEVRVLRSMRETLVPQLPVSQKSELKRRLDAALVAENYELAAILRDELRTLKE